MKHYDKLKTFIESELKSVDTEYEFELQHYGGDQYYCYVWHKNFQKCKIRLMAEDKYIAVYYIDNIWMEIKRNSPSIKYLWIALLS